MPGPTLAPALTVPLDQISTVPDLSPANMVLRYGDAIRRYLEGLLPNADAIEDVTRNFLVKILRGNLAQWDPSQGRFRDYVKRAVRNTALDYLRECRNRPSQLEEPALLPAREGRGGSTDQVWVDLWRECVIAAARQGLRRFEEEHPGNVFATLIDALAAADAQDDNAADLAARLSQATGTRYTAANARKQKERARRKFAQLLVLEVVRTLDRPTPDQVRQELAHLGLTSFVAPYVSLSQLLPRQQALLS